MVTSGRPGSGHRAPVTITPHLPGQTGVPTSFDPTFAGTATTFIPLYGVSGS